MTKEKALPYLPCTASGFPLLIFATLRPARRTLKKFTAANMRAKATATKPWPVTCCSCTADTAPTSRAVELMMASKKSSMISDTPPQTENSAIRRHLLIHLRRHELEQFPIQSPRDPLLESYAWALQL